MSKIQGLITKVAIKADAQGNPPATIELLRIGDWHTPWHGDFEITMADLHEFAANFGKGVGLVEADKRAPINYAHEAWNEAAGWMTSLSIDEGRNALVANCEWTTKAAEALREGLWAYISPEFNPRGCPWSDAEGTDDPDEIPEFVNNVLTGAALTNIPLFKKLKPIMASRVPSKKKKADVTSGDGGDNSNKGETMTLEDIRAKQVADLTDEEKTFLSEHKAELTDDERTTFGLVKEDDAEAKAKADKEAADKAAAEEAAKAEADAKAAEAAEKLEASKKGAVQISASKLAKLEADAAAGREAQQTLAKKEAQDFIAASVKKGQIKSGEQESAVKVLLASSGDQRTALEAFITGLPEHKLGEELGDQGKNASVGGLEELDTKVVAAIKASAEKGNTLSYAKARKEILKADAELAERVKQEEET